MMAAKRRTHEPRISIVTRSGAAIGSDKENEKRESESAWVRKTTKKFHVFDIQKEKEVFMEEKQSFMDSRASTSSAQPKPN